MFLVKDKKIKSIGHVETSLHASKLRQRVALQMFPGGHFDSDVVVSSAVARHESG
jgi:hypothetical protein